MTVDVRASLGPLALATPLVGASGTVGSGWELAAAAPTHHYGALIAKSVSEQPWPGRPPPRLAGAGIGMLNGIGIQNPGVEAWLTHDLPRIRRLPVPVWGSVVGETPAEFARVAGRLAEAGLVALELNLSCPNLDGGHHFALDAAAAAEVVLAVREATTVPFGAKLSPNAEAIVAVAAAVAEAGADWVTLTNTVWGAAIDIEARRPLLSGGVGGYSGPPLKPIALRCVLEVSRALPDLAILGCGGVSSGLDVIEYLMAGASAVAIGTAHFAYPRVAGRILGEVRGWCERHRVGSIDELVGVGR